MFSVCIWVTGLSACGFVSLPTNVCGLFSSGAIGQAKNGRKKALSMQIDAEIIFYDMVGKILCLILFIKEKAYGSFHPVL